VYCHKHFGADSASLHITLTRARKTYRILFCFLFCIDFRFTSREKCRGQWTFTRLIALFKH